MIHFLRDSMNRSIVDIEAMPGEIHCSVLIGPYSEYLLNEVDDYDKGDFMGDMAEIQEIRGIFFERFNGNIDSDALAQDMCVNLANRWGLYYVTD